MVQGGFRVGLGWVRVDLLVSGGFGSIRLVPAFSSYGLSDGFGFLLFDGETVGPGAGRLRNRSIINDKKQRNSFAR